VGCSCSYCTVCRACVFLSSYKIDTVMKNHTSDYTGAETGHEVARGLSGSRMRQCVCNHAQNTEYCTTEILYGFSTSGTRFRAVTASRGCRVASACARHAETSSGNAGSDGDGRAPRALVLKLVLSVVNKICSPTGGEILRPAIAASMG